MQDIKTYIDKLRDDADACTAISQTATNEAKRKVFIALADTYRKRAGENRPLSGHLFVRIRNERIEIESESAL